MIFITRSELNRMAKQVLDTNTGMTALDRFENEHCYEDWEIIEDVKEKSDDQGMRICPEDWEYSQAKAPRA